MSTEPNQRKYDIIVFGATGFTGELTCEYLVEINDKELRWAIAGRSRAKLQKTRERLAAIDESCQSLDLLIADSGDLESLENAVRQARVVISTVGPFMKYGTLLVEACVRQKTHYVDITGEYPWVSQMIDRFHGEAVKNNVMIVPCCGFDSVPSDMGTFMVCDYMQSRHNLSTADVKMSLTNIVGGFSGGTIQSAVGMLADKSLSASKSTDPYLLSPIRGPDQKKLPWMNRDPDFGRRWQGCFLMSVVNEKVVRRSWGLYTERGHSYGQAFKYRETWTLSFIPALIMTMAMLTVAPLAAVALKIPAIASLASRLLPGSGAGPDREQRMKGRFEMQFVATAETEPYDEPVRVRGVVKGFRDPGYGDTCLMVAESALCIVKSLDELPGKEGGILTPASAFGHTLLNRLRANNRMVFEVKDM
ncbi:saccharopine dehydrogenase [Radiomyces spectabilis]|uniref:saccharopine dehydrogenase n=1 Tax=Radiomyces spectabilis TaxID=64574 RepID=UPI00221EB965|nr:saccharopine dehydrogenase [Radiomyces spectabilis]KAI8371660.1 saccharopine dehydrogenase [Radiomyces spectabilis]